MTYPPFPWRMRLRGLTLVALHPVAIRDARRWVPPSLRIVRAWPGTTIGGLYLADYGPGSDLTYRELVATCAVIWHEGRFCPWVTHVYVDDPDSVEGGRRELGVPKELARFEAAASPAGTTVLQGDRALCTLVPSRPFWLWRQRVRFCAMHRHAERPDAVSLHGNEISGRMGVCAVATEIPPGSPLRALGLGPAVIGLCGSDMDALLGGAPLLPQRTIQL